MSLHGWLQNLRSALASRRGQRKLVGRGSLRAATHRLNLEPLEDRRLLAFLAPVDYAVGSGSGEIVSADFNNDNILDLAVANYSDNTVSVLLGNADLFGSADGTFQPAESYYTGVKPVSLAVGDLDGDGKIDDLATANYGYGYGYPAYDGNVSVLLGNDDGTFTARWVLGGQGRPASVAVGDFNGDGKMDLGVTVNDYYYHSGGWTSTANVLLGTGGGNFSAPKSTFLGRPLLNLALAADLNGDAYDDFVTLTPDYNSGQYLVVLQFGTSSGFLQGPSLFHTDSFGLAAGDIDGDGDNDLVTEYHGVVLGDFTHDGNLDVATPGSVLYGRGDGTFSTPAPTGSNAWGLAAGDFNGDGWLDAATTNQGGVSVLINDHTWPNPPPLPLSVSINDLDVTEGHIGTATANFIVTLSSDPTKPVTVNYTTADGSATAADGDYQSTSGTLTFNPGSPLTQTIPVLVNGDRRAESDFSANFAENFVVNITSADVVSDSQGFAIIADDEPNVSIGDASVIEGNRGAMALRFILTLSAIYDADVTVGFTTQNGSATTADNDYQPASSIATIAAGNRTTTVTINVNGDEKIEIDESLFVTLIGPTSAHILDGQAVGTIRNDDAVPRISISDVTKKEGKSNQTTLFTFTVTLSAAYDQPVTMSYRTVNGTATTGDSDYIAKTGTLTFAPGQITKTITIEVKGDSKKESNETFYLDLFGLSSNALFTKNRGIGTLLNDD